MVLLNWTRRRRDAKAKPRLGAQTEPAAQVPPVSTTLEAQASEAARIQQVQNQELLADPATNPATRAKLEDLRAHQHDRELALQRMEIDTEQVGREQELLTRAELHKLGLQATLDSRLRAARRARSSQDAADRIADRQQASADRYAENAARVQELQRGAAERSLHTVQQVREEAQPARRIVGLRADRSRFVKAAMAASVLLSVASAYGMGVAAQAMGMHAAAGWVLEVAFTGLSVMAITYRSQLRALGGAVAGWQDVALWVLFGGPLMASVAVTGLAALLVDEAPMGLVLSACAAVGAAVMGAFAHLASEISSVAINLANAKVNEEDLEKLVEAAAGTQVAPPEPIAFDASALLGQNAALSAGLPNLLRRPTEQQAEQEPKKDPEEGLLALLGDAATRDRVIDLIAQMGSAALDHQQGASPADLGMPRGASPDASGGASPDASPWKSPLERIWRDTEQAFTERLKAWIQDMERMNKERLAHGEEAEEISVRGAARDLKVDPRTVRRYRDDAHKADEHGLCALYPASAGIK